MNYRVITIVGIAVTVALVVLLASLYSGLKLRRERRELERWVEQADWTLTPKPREGWVRWLPRGAGRSRVRNMVTGIVDGRRVSVGQYHASDGEHYWPWIGVCAELRDPLPATTVWFFHVFTGLSRADRKRLGGTEVATGNHQFDSEFRISTHAPDTLPRWFGPSLIAAHVNGQMPKLWSVQDREVVAQLEGELVPEDIAHHAARVLPLADLLDGSSR